MKPLYNLIIASTLGLGILFPIESHVYGQAAYRFRHYNLKDGLDELRPEPMVTDGLGFVWFLHTFSLSRFDGYDFRVYRHDPNDSLLNFEYQMLNLGAVNLLVDPQGELWLANAFLEHQSGYIFKYDRQQDGFIRFKPDLNGSRIGPIGFDHKETILWLGGRKGTGLFQFNTKTGKTQKYLNPNSDSSSLHLINTITSIQDYDSVLLLGTRKGRWIFNKTSNNFKHFLISPKDSLFLSSFDGSFIGIPREQGHQWARTSNRKTFLILDSSYSIIKRLDLPDEFNYNRYQIAPDGKVWFATLGHGLYRWDSNDNSFTNFRKNKADPYSLSDNDVYDITIDSKKNFWVSTASGVSRLEMSILQFYNTQDEANYNYYSIENSHVGIKADEISIAQITLEDSIPIQSLKMKPFSKTANLEEKRIFWVSIFQSGVIGLPINSNSGLPQNSIIRSYTKDPNNPNTISTDSTSVVWEDQHQNLWVGTYYGLNRVSLNMPYGEPRSVVRFRHNPRDSTSISHDVVRDILKEDDNSLWIATESGVDLLRDGKFLHVFKDHERVSDIFKTSDGTLFVGTLGGLYEGEKKDGIYAFTKSTVVTTAIGESPAFAEDRQGRIWITTHDESLICYDRKLKIAIKFGEPDGLVPSWRLGQMKSGIMVLRNRNGFSVFDPLSLKISEDKVLPLLTKLEINNKLPVVGNRKVGKDDYHIKAAISVLDYLELDYRHNDFTIEFSAMDMSAPEKNLYRHKLEGYDNDWIEANYKNRRATYTNLPVGEYTFKVKASNHYGVWSDQERSLKVIILPPPWRTWWAYSGYGLLVAGLLVWARKNIVQRERLKSSLALAKVEQEKEHFELEKAKEVDKVKTSFFTNISHEFRTPLTLIKGPVQNILDRYKDDPKLQEQLKLVQRNSDLLLKLINQLLDLAKLESGSLKVEKTEGDVFSFVRAIASSFKSFARQKNVSIQVNVPEGSCPALFDKDKVETILINLINNAVKFTPSGGSVIITASLSPNAQGLVFSVRDTGIGIPPEHQSKIFERFHQVSEAHKEVGTGIGLALVKELVTLMGGEIAITSEVGVGSEFTVHIPIELVASHQLPVTGDQTPVTSDQPETGNWKPATESTLKEHGQSAKPHILVVEDNTDLRHFIIDSLGNEFLFLEAENGKQGLDIATNEIPDLIISDVMMPEMDGITMAGKIKTDIRTSHVPLILLTAKSSEDSKLSGLSSGADDYLIKPFNKNELLLKVRNGVNRQLKLRERLRAELMSTAPKVEVLSEDEKFLNSVKEKILERLSDEQLSVESLSDDIGMSRVQLYRKVSGLTGISVNELIRKLRLQRAAQLLQQKWGPVSQVAYEVGFSNLSYFSKVFKEEFGVLPSEYGIKTV
jgi:signal transduction histidine kinase/DNA-binding response OmpR family regulator/ligand-binding sensor domain-containing protein